MLNETMSNAMRIEISPPSVSATIYYDTVYAPFGELMLLADGESITELHLDAAEVLPVPRAEWRKGAPVLQRARAQLEAYFAGELRDFDLPLALRGTEFQRRVWSALCEIPYGTAISYAELARRVGSPRGFRAVGQANGANPVGIIVPCHRVIASDTKLGGYSGGLDRKRWLLAHEGVAFAEAVNRRLF
jgi:methylated-DNA-[protein]-cysteine S-methyltransferase